MTKGTSYERLAVCLSVTRVVTLLSRSSGRSLSVSCLGATSRYTRPPLVAPIPSPSRSHSRYAGRSTGSPTGWGSEWRKDEVNEVRAVEA